MPTRRKNARKNPSTTLLVGGGVAALAVAVAAWWWFRGRSPDDRLLLEGEGGGKGKGKFSPAKLQGALKVKPNLKALSGQSGASGSATGETTVPGPALVGVMPPTPPGASSYFYTPPTR